MSQQASLRLPSRVCRACTPCVPGMAGARGMHAPLPLPASGRSQHGFSLLEVLVAVVLFALASALAYGGLRAIVAAQEQEIAAKTRLGRLQFAIGLIERDVVSAARRGIRDNYGAPRPALEGTAQRLELTRHGLANALLLPRAELERVAYLKRDDRLLRLRWPVLDRAPGTLPSEDELIDGVERMELVFLDVAGREHRQWPPPRGVAQTLPRGLRLTLELRGLGEIRRVLELPQEPVP